MLINKNTPNIAAYYYSVLIKPKFYRKINSDCKIQYCRFASSMISEFNDPDDKDAKDVLDFKTLHVMAIEDLVGKDVTEWISSASYFDIKSIIFQVIFTLECLNYIGVRHNDLHDKNIFVVKNKNPEYLYYITDYNESTDTIKCFKIKTLNGIAKIYDFDNGCVVKNQKLVNSKINYFNMKKYGVCHTINEKFDSFTFFGYLLYELIFQTMEYQDILEIDEGLLSLPFEVIKKIIEKVNRKDSIEELNPIMKDLFLAFKVYDLIQK